ncbi:hypothetical protein OC709_02590 ['Planchonia careya' phytoplasma]|nr:hypothetical protein ['Planchonia careya' phytoplasma]MDO8030375.1 hypothetical protein ['Planchonia careya' phytoplasma]
MIGGSLLEFWRVFGSWRFDSKIPPDLPQFFEGIKRRNRNEGKEKRKEERKKKNGRNKGASIGGFLFDFWGVFDSWRFVGNFTTDLPQFLVEIKRRNRNEGKEKRKEQR